MADETNEGGKLAEAAEATKKLVSEQIRSAFSSPKKLAITSIFAAVTIASAGTTAGVMAMTPTNYAAPALL
ncbi:MAG: hypothetical protein CL570_05050 [Alphaproteobacteria bacterium]|nr:hypothetical protein [Alphaproteobacteria bacterium]HCQ71081.1 hypothetical protein [Rhodospirillaceae bacterium]|tara:strand:+ start:44544 stop:44756 length:213 start_codon:yes stop_codon:yes gene_type:complete